MQSRVGLVGAVSVWVALAGGVVLAVGDAAGSGVVDVVGAALLAAGVFGFLGMSITRSRQDGLGVTAAVGHSAKDALRLAWVVFKGA